MYSHTRVVSRTFYNSLVCDCQPSPHSLGGKVKGVQLYRVAGDRGRVAGGGQGTGVMKMSNLPRVDLLSVGRMSGRVITYEECHSSSNTNTVR